MITDMTDIDITELFETKDLKLIKNFAQNLDDINICVYREDGNSLNLLHFCAGIEDTVFASKCLKLLISLPNIDVNSFAKIDGIQGITASHIAAQWGHENTLQTLIQLGSDLFLCDSYGHNVYDYAIKSNNKKCVELVDTAIKTYHRSQSINSFLNKSQIKCSNVEPKNLINTNDNELLYSSVSDKTLLDINSDNNSKSSEDCEQTETYFNENDSVWRQMRSSSCDGSQSTLISNVSYEKTDSIKSCDTDIAETYLYNDKDHDVVLIEERYQGSSSLTNLYESDVISMNNATKDSDDKDMDEMIRLMNNTQIYDELKAMGDSPGPIMTTTRRVYAKRLGLMRRGKYSPSKTVFPLPNYSEQLNRLIQNTFPFDEAVRLERQLIKHFENEPKTTYFNYILLDPNLTQNLPFQANHKKITLNSYEELDMSLFLKFIKAIFYVGKGQGNRTYEHFYEAIKSNDKKSDKINRILKIWSTDKGVISLHCFTSISSDEALTREALMIEALMLSNLTNKVNGQYKCNFKWNDRKRRIIGSYFLYKAFLILLINGERQIKRPHS